MATPGAVCIVRPERLQACCAALLAACGMPPDAADLVAHILVEADLRGVHSHGTLRLPGYVRGLRAADGINPEPALRLAALQDATAVLDADRGMGQVAAHRAMQLAIELAKRYGLGAVTVRNSNHCGALAYYAEMALPHRCIGFAITNAGINMTPWGGTQRLVGNNPMAYAIPTPRGWPIVLDMATSVAAGGKLDVAARRGEAIPLGWALDPAGQPTTDPRLARAGSLLSVGGPKGYALAVVLDILAGVLSGGRFGAGLGARGSAHYFQAIKIDHFMSYDAFLARIEQLIDQLQACPLAPGVERILLPGQYEAELKARRQKEGIPLDEETVEQLEGLAAELGLASSPTCALRD